MNARYFDEVPFCLWCGSAPCECEDAGEHCPVLLAHLDDLPDMAPEAGHAIILAHVRQCPHPACCSAVAA